MSLYSHAVTESPTHAASGQLPDELVRVLSSDGGISVRALIGTRMMGEPFGARRISAAACVAAGVIFLPISKG